MRGTCGVPSIRILVAEPARVEIEVVGDPRPQGSKTAWYNQKTQRVVMLDGKGPGRKLFVEWRKAVKAAAKAAYIGRPLNGPVTVDLTFRLERPKTVDRDYPSIAPDLDKLTRAVFDSLTGVVFVDDALVVGLVARKLYAENQPVGVTIIVKEVR